MAPHSHFSPLTFITQTEEAAAADDEPKPDTEMADATEVPETAVAEPVEAAVTESVEAAAAASTDAAVAEVQVAVTNGVTPTAAATVKDVVPAVDYGLDEWQKFTDIPQKWRPLPVLRVSSHTPDLISRAPC